MRSKNFLNNLLRFVKKNWFLVLIVVAVGVIIYNTNKSEGFTDASGTSLESLQKAAKEAHEIAIKLQNEATLASVKAKEAANASVNATKQSVIVNDKLVVAKKAYDANINDTKLKLAYLSAQEAADKAAIEASKQSSIAKELSQIAMTKGEIAVNATNNANQLQKVADEATKKVAEQTKNASAIKRVDQEAICKKRNRHYRCAPGLTEKDNHCYKCLHPHGKGKIEKDPSTNTYKCLHDGKYYNAEEKIKDCY